MSGNRTCVRESDLNEAGAADASACAFIGIDRCTRQTGGSGVSRMTAVIEQTVLGRGILQLFHLRLVWSPKPQFRSAGVPQDQSAKGSKGPGFGRFGVNRRLRGPSEAAGWFGHLVKSAHQAPGKLGTHLRPHGIRRPGESALNLQLNLQAPPSPIPHLEAAASGDR